MSGRGLLWSCRPAITRCSTTQGPRTVRNSVAQAMAPQWLLTSMAAVHPAIALAASAGRCEAGARWQWDGVDFELLHPAPDNYAREKFRGNDRSCVLKITAGDASVLLAADVEQKSEREMLASVPDKLRAQILLV